MSCLSLSTQCVYFSQCRPSNCSISTSLVTSWPLSGHLRTSRALNLMTFNICLNAHTQKTCTLFPLPSLFLSLSLVEFHFIIIKCCCAPHYGRTCRMGSQAANKFCPVPTCQGRHPETPTHTHPRTHTHSRTHLYRHPRGARSIINLLKSKASRGTRQAGTV